MIFFITWNFFFIIINNFQKFFNKFFFKYNKTNLFYNTKYNDLVFFELYFLSFFFNVNKFNKKYFFNIFNFKRNKFPNIYYLHTVNNKNNFTPNKKINDVFFAYNFVFKNGKFKKPYEIYFVIINFYIVETNLIFNTKPNHFTLNKFIIIFFIYIWKNNNNKKKQLNLNFKNDFFYFLSFNQNTYKNKKDNFFLNFFYKNVFKKYIIYYNKLFFKNNKKILYKNKIILLFNSKIKINFFVSNISSFLNLNKLKIYNLMYLRKNKIFNKGRYSRNRQLYRTGVYWCLWLNILLVYGLYFIFYRFSFNFGYIWWGCLILLYSTIFSRILKYNFTNPYTIIKEVFYFLKWLGLLIINFLKIFNLGQNYKSKYINTIYNYYFKHKNKIYINNIQFSNDNSFLKYKSIFNCFSFLTKTLI